MLVLSRKLNESIHIGDNIVVTITKIASDRVSIGITAPADIKITREELMSRLTAATRRQDQPRS